MIQKSWILDESFNSFVNLMLVSLEGFHLPNPLVPFLLVPQEDVEGLAIFGAEWGRTGTELKAHLTASDWIAITLPLQLQ